MFTICRVHFFIVSFSPIGLGPCWRRDWTLVAGGWGRLGSDAHRWHLHISPTKLSFFIYYEAPVFVWNTSSVKLLCAAHFGATLQTMTNSPGPRANFSLRNVNSMYPCWCDLREVLTVSQQTNPNTTTQTRDSPSQHQTTTTPSLIAAPPPVQTAE